MKISLPPENWHDVFQFLPRPQLAEIVSQIGDWYFSTKVQYYLHECGQITLGHLWIKRPSRSGNGPEIVVLYGPQSNQNFPIADVPIPENIINFTGIRISHYDESVLQFLQEFHRNSLFTNANVNFSQYEATPINTTRLSAFLTNLVPFLNNINSVEIYGRDWHLLTLFQNEHSQLAMPMLTSARVLKTLYNSAYKWFCDWLKPGPDVKPRVLVLLTNLPNLIKYPIVSFVEHIKKDFMEAKQAISFFIFINLKLFPDPDRTHCQSCSLVNLQTKEKLAVGEGDYGCVTISRHPMEATQKWLENMANYEENYYEYRNITFDCSS